MSAIYLYDTMYFRKVMYTIAQDNGTDYLLLCPKSNNDWVSHDEHAMKAKCKDYLLIYTSFIYLLSW